MHKLLWMAARKLQATPRESLAKRFAKLAWGLAVKPAQTAIIFAQLACQRRITGKDCAIALCFMLLLTISAIETLVRGACKRAASIAGRLP